ncbi:MAG: FAD-binding oxidoreductase [Solirubrobacteraceae bacterium]
MATPAAVRRLDARLGGRAAHRDEGGWEGLAVSRFPNLEVPWAPDVVVRAAGTADVIIATHFAREHELGLAVRSGGVGWVGAPSGTLLLDLQDMHAVRIDPWRRTVHVQGGAIWRDVHRELAPFGLAAAGPQFPRLGVTGHVLGGGHGWLSRRVGWASDTLRSAELVTADGRYVRCSQEEEPELFWAIRGAGPNFGSVVGVELDLIALDSVAFGMVWFDPDATADGLMWCRDHLPDAPDELTTIVSIGHPPGSTVLPSRLRGRGALHVLACHCGPPERRQRDLAALRAQPHVTADTIREMPWSELAIGNDVFDSGVHRRSRMHYVNDLSDAVIAISTRRATEMAPLSFMSTHVYGGAMERIDEHATAMSHRSEHFNYMVSTTWTAMEDGAALRRWHDAYLDEIAPHATGAAYVNYLFDEPARIRSAYHPATWERLRAIKRAADPTNCFAANQNIPPAVDVASGAVTQTR